jgi:environmental stress-induced protein Ves
MRWRLLPQAGFRAMPWRNGGGTTWEIAQGRFGDGSDGGEVWHWRLSRAEIATDGPFSLFPGIDRLLTVIQGAGITLRLDGGAARTLYAGDDIQFTGEAAVDCSLLAGPTQDLNLMVDRRTARFRTAGPMIATEGTVVVLYAFEDVVVSMGRKRMTILAGDAAVGEGGSAEDVRGRAFRACISPRGTA